MLWPGFQEAAGVDSLPELFSGVQRRDTEQWPRVGMSGTAGRATSPAVLRYGTTPALSTGLRCRTGAHPTLHPSRVPQ